MANYVTVATLAPTLPQLPFSTDFPALVKHMKNFWTKHLLEVLPSKPDLILLPEACDRYDNFSSGESKQYYSARGDEMLAFFQEKANEYQSYIVYSAARKLEDDTFRNSSYLIDRKGKVVGIYNKNHLVETEILQENMRCGKEAPLFLCDFGKVAMAICFDLNFEELLQQHKISRPAIILFSSRYHGGFHQQYWAYSCQAYFVGACHMLPSQVVSPVGEIIAHSTNYHPYAIKTINLDYQVVHLDFHWEKLLALQQKYGELVQVSDPGYVGAVLVESHHPNISVGEMLNEFEIISMDDYFAKQRDYRLRYTEE